LAGRTVTRLELYKAVHQEVGLSRDESAELVEAVLGKIAGSLVKGESVKLSSFGTFVVREKSARLGRNPRTGEAAPVSARRVLVFRPSHLLKDRVNRFLSRADAFGRKPDQKQGVSGQSEIPSE
jgi:integration host factor subunit alpha